MDQKTLNIIEKIVLLALIAIMIFYREYYLIVILSLIELFLIIYRIYRNKLEEKIEEERKNWQELAQYSGEVEYIIDRVESWGKEEKEEFDQKGVNNDGK